MVPSADQAAVLALEPRGPAELADGSRVQVSHGKTPSTALRPPSMHQGLRPHIKSPPTAPTRGERSERDGSAYVFPVLVCSPTYRLRPHPRRSSCSLRPHPRLGPCWPSSAVVAPRTRAARNRIVNPIVAVLLIRTPSPASATKASWRVPPVSLAIRVIVLANVREPPFVLY